MTFRSLLLCLALLVAIAVYVAGNYIDYVREVNRTTINRTLGE
jgi:hypothetical protein